MTDAGATSLLVVAHMWWDSGWGVVWAFVMLAFWIAVVAVIVVLVRGVARRPDGGGGSALRMLEERYARGEITRDEFLDRRSVLTDTGTQQQT